MSNCENLTNVSSADKESAGLKRSVTPMATLEEIEAAIDIVYDDAMKDTNQGATHDRIVAVSQCLGIVTALDAVRKLYQAKSQLEAGCE